MNENEQYELNAFSLAFKSPKVEGEFLQEVAQRRWPVLIWVFAFDVFCFSLRFVAKLTTGTDELVGTGRPFEVVQEMGHQLANMAMLYVLIGLLNKRARTAGNNAARQEEVLLSICMGLAICNLLASLRTDNAQDYVYVSYFLICTSTFLKIRWWVGTGLLATPMVAVQLWYASPAPSALLPADAFVHIVVAWAVGGLMAYLSDWYRRQMYANARLACAAHEKEMMEATARIQAQRELAAAQAQAAQRALTVAREKAAHEAKSEFMSLMCHEVRTPLNGCLASAEMLLETPLKEEQRELANTIRVSGSILLSTVSNFLDFFKLEAGKRLDIVRSEIFLSDLVSDVHCIIEAMIGRGGAVTLQQPQLIDVPEYVCCDPDRLRGILLNLYTNAAKFTKRGHIVLRVQSVARDYTPPAPAGYSAIMLQPCYHPSNSSHRSMDISSCIVMSPAPEQQQQQQVPGAAASVAQQQANSSNTDVAHQQQPVPTTITDVPEHQGNATAAALQPTTASAEANTVDSSSSKQQQQQQQTCLPEQQNQHMLCNCCDAAGDEQQQQQPLWQQASRWALDFLPKGQKDLLLDKLAPAGASEQCSMCRTGNGTSCSNLQATAAAAAAATACNHGDASSSSNSNDLQATAAARKAARAAGISKGTVHFDVHAMSSSSDDGVAENPAAAAAGRAKRKAGSSAKGNNSSGSDVACWLLFEVEDTGVGITRDGLATLFREYVQGTDDEMCKPRTRGGTGLGLSICSKQVGVLGGVIGAHSCKGNGSTFWFKIPTYVKAHKTSLSSSSSRELKQQEQPQQQQQQSSQLLNDVHEQYGEQQQQQQQCSGEVRVSLSQQSLDSHNLLEQQQQEQRQQPVQQHNQSLPPLPISRSSSNSSNTGTYSVIHSGLYHTSSSSGIGSKQEQQSAGKQQHGGLDAAAAVPNCLIDSGQHAAAGQSHQDSAAAVLTCSSRTGVTSSSTAQVAVLPPHASAPAAAVHAGAGAPLAASSQKPPQPPGAAAAAAAASSPVTPAAAAPAAVASSMAGGSSNGGGAAVLPRARQSLSLDGRAPAVLDTTKLAGRRVLLAEDNLINQTVARKMLSSLGMQVEVAMNGLEALQAVQRTAECKSDHSPSSKGQPFSVVLMDMAMPVMGGVESTRAIRADGFDLPIVAMTANASDKDRDECAAAGMNAFLSKPVLRDQLARALLAAIDERDVLEQHIQGSSS